MANSSPEGSGVAPTTKECFFMLHVLASQEGKPKVDWNKVAEATGLKNGGVASVRFGQIKKRIGWNDLTKHGDGVAGSGLATPAAAKPKVNGSGTNISPSKVRKTPAKPKGPTKPRTPRKKKEIASKVSVDVGGTSDPEEDVKAKMLESSHVSSLSSLSVHTAEVAQDASAIAKEVEKGDGDVIKAEVSDDDNTSFHDGSGDEFLFRED